MKKNLLMSCTLFFLMNSALHASAAVKLVDYMMSSSGIIELLGKNGIKGADAKQVESYLVTSMGSFGGGKNLSQEEFREILGKLPVTGQDANIRKDLQVLLDKSDKDLSKEDVVKAINNIIYLANRHGKSVIIACADCVSDSLAKSGFKFTVENIQSSTSVKILNDIIPNNPKDLNKFISSKMKRLGFGDYSKVAPNMILPSEEKTFALFLASYESGTTEYKELGAIIKKLSTVDGKTDIFNPANPNKLWRIVSSDISGAEASRMTETLKEVDTLATKEKATIEEAFNRVVRKKSESSTELFEKFKAIKNKRCFFK